MKENKTKRLAESTKAGGRNHNNKTSEMSVFTSSERAINDPATRQQASVDPNSMLSSHKAPEYVRQLDKLAMKNAMEEALLRHEKEISVR